MTASEKPPRQEPVGRQGEEPRVIDARQLFGERAEVWIEHEGVRYRLRITRRNKLILQK
ncbi:MAG: hemin uptake protein HemP [Gemmataceae bacterium]|nr:hemin uptake protein HemP [Gemmataceae bacterium]